ncbi:MAG: iron-containing alcohol dehydrogenase, partial [Akkermansiaceae bacterium]
MSTQQYYHGEDGWSELCNFLDTIEAGKILLVTGNQMYKASGAKDSLQPVLKHKQVLHLTCIQANPLAEDIDTLLEQIENKTSYQAIIAIGGGSVIDTAKLLKAF